MRFKNAFLKCISDAFLKCIFRKMHFKMHVKMNLKNALNAF